MAIDFNTRPNWIPWPPILLIAAGGAAYLLQRGFPTSGLLPDWLMSFGEAVLALGLAFDFWAMGVMFLARTNILPNRGAGRLVTRGPFTLTRNPIYLGNTLLLIGIGLAFSALWFLPLALLAAFLVDRLAIRREEAHLALRFGAEWEAYAAKTPRWLRLPF
ncbi:isoprenylcysteine carboxylmethyltransferase family protein [Rhodoblastus acidophilus]|uniref:Isoprenylcysteine carboxylmethyltransferase family protein n=1 Tax=Candidatus Rhodoblastus alkanivorans TaxID=2954117 RepID=A0ABS9ZA55_9HYPH|nr:isoprenylcysteine carboxylmethyltransferase family protein [Candidatus Rhodoblastus alkanivorans]MCI4680678.1 isoprenylcysteine carboxylmethyltransferase family protein [Candidatus Rhodoblastus alkanivorans]MCI4684365.1 isoprenylcysteine carboxylmethyltransferase family protein [Candidatus Rhodoblastus alkanivorans]MDI4641686.1 isoprenylcysteine carboxylmethyltransferase family protein [Rhodoblastus acidophilus]